MGGEDENPFGAMRILQAMADALPTHAPNDTTSDVSSSHELVALLTHACMVANGFRLLGFDEGDIKGTPVEKRNHSGRANHKPYLTEAECHELAPQLPANWNASFNTYTFIYEHRRSACRFIVKVARMGGKAEIRGMALKEDLVARSEIVIKDFISNAALPIRITMTPEGEEDRSDLRQKLQNVFVSVDSVEQLANSIGTNIVQVLTPTARMESLRETPDDMTRLPIQASHPDIAPPPTLQDTLPPSARARIPVGDFPPPDFEDPYDLNRPPAYPASTPAHMPFGNIGADDLYPPGLGPHDPLHPGLRIPPFPQRPQGGGGGGGGMHPTFDDPLFGGRGGMGGMGGEFDPQVPPGARYDPLGPGGEPRFSGRGPRGGNGAFGGGGAFGRGGSPFGGGGGGGPWGGSDGF